MVNISHSAQLVTPDQAKFWLTCNYKHQRKRSEQHVKRLALAMQDEQFASTEPLSFGLLHGQLNLLNGQHTLAAIVMSGKPQFMVIIHHEVDSESELANLYFKFDRQRKRTFSDGVRAVGLAGDTNLSNTQINAAASALRFAKGGFGVERAEMELVSTEDLLEWIPYWKWEINAIEAAISPCNNGDRRMIYRRAVYSVALVTMRYKPDKARGFWQQMAQDDELGRYDPRKTLRSWLQTNMSTRNFKTPRGDHEAARAVAHAWNAFMEDRQLRYMIVRDTTCTMNLKGTAFNGKQDSDFLPLYPSPHIEAERTKQLAVI